MAFAVMDAFPEKTPAGEEKRKALLWRAMLAFRCIANDARCKDYVREKDGQKFVASALMEAAATQILDAAGACHASPIGSAPYVWCRTR